MAFASDRSVRWECWLHRLGSAIFILVVVAGASGFLGKRASVVGHSILIYLFLLVVFRVAGRRTLAQTTTFDLVLILIIGDATQQALLGEDTTMASGALAVLSLVSLDVALAHLRRLFPVLDRVIEGDPVKIMASGQLRERPMAAYGLEAEDVIAAARAEHGITDLNQVREAVLEKDGRISIVPEAGTSP